MRINNAFSHGFREFESKQEGERENQVLRGSYAEQVLLAIVTARIVTLFNPVRCARILKYVVSSQRTYVEERQKRGGYGYERKTHAEKREKW